MKKKGREERKSIHTSTRRWTEARKNFERVQKEIAPFIKRRAFKECSTVGKWRETSSLYS